MTLTLRIEGTGAVPGGTDAIAMRGEALSIGRAPGNDLVLPDPERVVSSRHCVLEARGGDYLLVDISTNGTFVNYASEAVGPTPIPINNGDVIGIGRYELRVEIAAQPASHSDPFAHLPPPVEAAPIIGHRNAQADVFGIEGNAASPPGSVGTDFIDELLGSEPAGAGRRAELRPDPRPEDLLPPDIVEDPLAAPRDEPVAGASLANHNPSTQDHFTPPPVRQDLIPDDWDLEPGPSAGPGALPPVTPPPVTPPPATPPHAMPPQAMPPSGGAPQWGGTDGQSDPFLQPPGAPAAPPVDPFAEAGRPAPPPDPFAEISPAAHPGTAPAAPDPFAAAPAVRQAPPAPQAPPVPQTSPVQQAAPPTSPPNGPPNGIVEAPPVQRSAPAGDLVAARAFLREAGIPQDALGDDELEEVMSRLGETFRILIGGLREVLIARAAIKNEFRLDQTVISVDGNNPLKFSVSTDHAMESMVKPATPGYQSAPVAAREAIDDIKAHEVAMMTGMQAAIDGLLKRFDPEKLSGRIERSGLTSLLTNRKARLWDQFEVLYGDIAREAEDDFQTLFGREFARAYQAQLRKL